MPDPPAAKQPGFAWRMSRSDAIVLSKPETEAGRRGVVSEGNRSCELEPWIGNQGMSPTDMDEHLRPRY